MEEDEGGPKLSKRFSDKGGEVDYKTKAGTAWSHSFLNQKPWHPLSYPNQRRKWIAEQTHAQRERRGEEIAREYAQEQEFLRQTSLLSQREKEKVDIMQAVSFMYVRPPGYNAESAKAAEIVDERKKVGENDPAVASSSSMPQQAASLKDEKKQARPKDVFGRSLPTEEEFAVLKNAPRLETGVAGRAKPFAVEVRNVKCVRCGDFGHQSGDRECPLKDAIMPNDENRLKRDDPLTAIMAQMDSSEEDIFDEYGGFLSGGNIPELLTNFSATKQKKKSKRKRYDKNVSHRRGHESNRFSSDSEDDYKRKKMKSKPKSKQNWASHRDSHEGNSSASDGDSDERILKMKVNRSKHKKRAVHLNSNSENDSTSDDYEHNRRTSKKNMHNKKNKKDLSDSSMSEDSKDEKYHGKSRRKDSHQLDSICRHRNCYSHRCRKLKHEGSSSDGERKSRRKGEKYRNKTTYRNDSEFSLSDDSESERHRRKHKHFYSSKTYNSKDHH